MTSRFNEAQYDAALNKLFLGQAISEEERRIVKEEFRKMSDEQVVRLMREEAKELAKVAGEVMCERYNR